MHADQLTDDTIRTLSQVEADEPVVVSLFLDLDPAQFAIPAARASQINSLLSELDALLRDPGLSPDAVEALGADRERIEAFLRDDDLDVEQAAALAIFSSNALDVFVAVKLPDAVASGVHLEQRPMLEPVMGMQDQGTWCVLLVTRDSARLFRGGPSGIRELRDVQSDVKNQHAAGGWSQGRFERSVEQEVEWHLERATGVLFREFKRRPFDHVVIGANNESLRPALMDHTHAYLTERIRGWIDIDEERAGADEVFAAVREVIDAHQDQEEAALFERLAAERATGGRAAEGLEPVLAALAEKRVETLVVREGAAEPGTKCVTCGWLGPAGVDRCPVDETRLDGVENIVEPAIQAAIQQSAAVHVVRMTPDEEHPGLTSPIASMLRY
jgi:peptide chain release factor subunit 1